MRQYIAPTSPDKSGLLCVQGKDYRYMKQVLRLAVGDMLDVRLPDGRLQGMTVCRIEEDVRRIVLQTCASNNVSEDEDAALDAPAQQQPELWLFQFIARSAKMDVIIRQATECGVSMIVPVISDFSQAGAKERNFRGDRYERIIKEARQQSGSAVATQVHEACTLGEALALWQEHCAGMANRLGVVLYERIEQTKAFHAAVAQAGAQAVQATALVCGAEGGISPAEIATLTDAGFIPVHFKTNILRCETAALYGIAALQTAIAEGDVWQYKE